MVTFIDESSQSGSEIFFVHNLKMKKATGVNTMPYSVCACFHAQVYIYVLNWAGPLITEYCADLVLSNKLILYDLEKQVIGWTEYN
ncbi:hypothetical protein PHJA_002424700 [Phtheirospermum japonicum]|uniref:Uncharacterized protein n=1 Tax=Phtheirospermum japonicum TaxID=374723 RepID=A0A830CQJ4_9LAMI|nr:hypothetical protein PHJA_002424700 [Phtheirospermum japonicum]